MMKAAIVCLLILASLASAANNTRTGGGGGGSSPKPYKRYVILSIPRNGSVQDCDSSSDDFPAFLPEESISKGGFVVCILIGIYCFTFLALVCDGYFLPCVEGICTALNISPDVAAATFMSVATSTPELFTNLIGTFITESDLGIGTIVGSSMFNALGVASVGSLAAPRPIQLEWFPILRDVIIYMFAISLLVVITWDGIIYWYEGLILFVAYFIYFAIMFQNVRISRYFFSKYNKWRNKGEENEAQEPKDIKIETVHEKVMERSLPGSKIASARPSVANSMYGSYSEEPIKAYIDDLEENDVGDYSLFKIPDGSNVEKCFFFYVWPLRLLLRCIIPNPRKYPKLLPLSFILCIVVIGVNSYLVSWMMTIIGNLLKIPDAVLGMTFLAAGGCLPEGTSLTIMSRRGQGSMGVSNSMGANTMNILFSLGMPWFFKTISMGANNSAFIKIQSGSIEYSVLALIPVAIALFVTLYFNGFRLCKKVAAVLITVYTVVITLSILADMVWFNDASMC